MLSKLDEKRSRDGGNLLSSGNVVFFYLDSGFDCPIATHLPPDPDHLNPPFCAADSDVQVF